MKQVAMYFDLSLLVRNMSVFLFLIQGEIKLCWVIYNIGYMQLGVLYVH